MKKKQFLFLSTFCAFSILYTACKKCGEQLYSRDTFDVFFKMKHGNCRDELENMEVKYLGATYNVDILGHSFTLLK